MASKRHVFILPSAEEEVDVIVSYLSALSAQAARGFVAEYRKQLTLLESGVIDSGLSKVSELASLGYHSCLINRHVMLYYHEGDDIYIAHIFHQRQDYARLV